MDDESFYELVAREVADRSIRPGLWAKALAQCSGDETAARARYIELRAEQLKEMARAEAVKRQADQVRNSVQYAKNAALTMFGRLVFCAAGLVLGLSGLATLFFGLESLSDRPTAGEAANVFIFAFAAFGLLLSFVCFKKASGTYS